MADHRVDSRGNKASPKQDRLTENSRAVALKFLALPGSGFHFGTSKAACARTSMHGQLDVGQKSLLA